MAEANPNTVNNPFASLQHAAGLLQSEPELAERAAREFLLIHPDHPQALLLLAQARGARGDRKAARDILVPLAAAHPTNAAVQAAMGTLLARSGETAAAMTALSRAVEIDPTLAHAWRTISDLRLLVGDSRGADTAYAQHLLASVKDPQLLEAVRALCDNRLAVAESLLRAFLGAHPADVTAIQMLADISRRMGRYPDAAKLLARCLELSPGSRSVRQSYANVLKQLNNAQEVIAQADILLRDEPHNPGVRLLKAWALRQIGDEARAVDEYESMLKLEPWRVKAWMNYGHALKALGRQEDCVVAYRKTIALRPDLGDVWWSLANLKTYPLTPDDVSQIEAQLARPNLGEQDRCRLHFALGKALEDQQLFARSFEHYREGNRLQRKTLRYRAAETTSHVKRSMAFFTPAFFAQRKGTGCSDPIFVVGLPRAGSTLIEQILASHSEVEGTKELTYLVSIARRLGRQMKPGDVSAYPEILAGLGANELRALGEEYLSRVRIHRRLGRPYFIDKLPNNFEHIGLIHLILPNAKIIDARRHPMACGFSVFKQLFPGGREFSYDFADIGQYYADYVALMSHFDAVLPGRIHRVFYERLVDNPEFEIRQLLNFCDLPFEEACLRFHENERAVRTASSEQVRLPMFRDSFNAWRAYEAWLEPLKTALAPVLASYPDVPGTSVPAA